MNLRLICLTILVLSTTACSIATPLVAAGAGGHAIARYEENIKVRGAAALKEEPDLLTYSVQAIARNDINAAANTYLRGLKSSSFNENMKSLTLYQIGLLYMNPYSQQRNDNVALKYFNRHLAEFPKSRLKDKINSKIELIKERQASETQLSADELLKLANRSELLAQNNIPFDSELTPMSERAIISNRITDAESVYLILYSNQGSSDDMRAKALYQMGLIYMSEYNTQGNNTKALNYFRKIVEEFPGTEISKQASKRMTQVINRQ